MRCLSPQSILRIFLFISRILILIRSMNIVDYTDMKITDEENERLKPLAF
jgi:hypothetical protein